ncbi:MAG TPA: response regulator [Ktedonobacteraceae bacterium]|jgi:chemosensory pili system protein ChpA (sensor histidine kinase/response regulator)
MSSLPQKKQILIVDDNQDIRLLLAQVLEEEYIYTIWLAKNGVEAIAQATQVHPDLILLDMSLPGMSGWEVVTHLRSLADLAQTPIVAVTASVSLLDQERALTLGCTKHLGKPFDLTVLLETIASLL